MPDLDGATFILFSGTSAGANGLRQLVDDAVRHLRRFNQFCRNPQAPCPLRIRALIDAEYQAAYETRNWAASTPYELIVNYVGPGKLLSCP